MAFLDLTSLACYNAFSMKNLLLSIFFFLLAVTTVSPVVAVEDPLSKPNNKVGIHLLFASELTEAAQLINGNNGEWGYIIVPIQSGDRDIKKWQDFLNEADKHKVIPIIRLATEGDYFNTKVWRKPKYEDIIDFANFLDSLHWPTKNRYVVVFNEVNRGDEWGGEANPQEYATLLSYAVTVFKSLNQDFFMIGGGFDNAAPNQGTQYIDQYTYIRAMNQEIPGIFNQIDGYASHSYPNPGFSQPPSVVSTKSISSFNYERALLQTMTSKKLPIFITETGWSGEVIDDQTRATYYEEAFRSYWNDPDIVTVIPFVLRASGPFAKFSFMKEDGSKTSQYTMLQNMSKIKGTPTLNKRVLGAQVQDKPKEKLQFPEKQEKKGSFTPSQVLRATFAWVMKL